ncbi:hypothetical protein JQX13_16415 [Archangium violaceum]|uniref:hypothetical protein n=1 Tax=Archangium violaceum TaxID=83451 RepID=UPI00193BE7D5|nr:hypothetical protein [Archangium violaceum]QRK11513.1 hypothetical protein JQX13_16415 [Archangium violaceum]
MRSNLKSGLRTVLGVTLLSATLGAGAAQAGGVYDDTYSYWLYSNGWALFAGGPYSDAYNGTLHLTQIPGSVATFTCLDSQAFQFFYTKAYNRGMFEVYLNGVKIGTYDGYSETLQRKTHLVPGGYYVGYRGNFNVTIKTLDAKNPASSGYFVDVDAIECSG